MGSVPNYQKKYMSPTRWSENEKNILINLFRKNKPFEEIAKRVNSYLKMMYNKYEFIIVRTPTSVAWECWRLKLITIEDLNNYIKQYKNKLQIDRFRNRYIERRKIFERDNKKCIICSSAKKLGCCHIIPFHETRKNEEMELITLCDIHHKEFDRYYNIEIVKKVYETMCLYYSDYVERYSLDETGGIIKRRGESKSGI